MSNYSEQFLKQNPLAVLGYCATCKRRGAAAHQLVKQSVHQQDPGCFCRELVIDPAAEHENRAALRAEKSR